MRHRAGPLTLACLLVVAQPAAAQTARPDMTGSAATKTAKAKKHAAGKARQKNSKEEASEPARPQEPAPDAARPYDAQLGRLAETMGALTFLRDLCNAGDGDDWRDKMNALLDADAPAGVRRHKLVGAFNRGFRSFELTYRSCTPNAEAAVARYLGEADRLAGELASRYGAQ